MGTSRNLGISLATIPAFLLLFLLASCESKEHYVIAATGTVIGVEVSQHPANQTPQAKLGYNRAELAIVPSNRPTCVVKDDGSVNCGNTNGSAEETPDVLMELRYGGIFDLGESSGIYQRLAVGPNAVKQPGAALMFAKNADGSVDQKAANLLKESGLVILDARRPKIDAIAVEVQDSSNPQLVDQSKLGALITKANLSGSSAKTLKVFKEIKDLKAYLEVQGSDAIDPLHAALN